MVSPEHDNISFNKDKDSVMSEIQIANIFIPFKKATDGAGVFKTSWRYLQFCPFAHQQVFENQNHNDIR